MIKVIYSADMQDANPQIQSEIKEAEERGEILTRIMHNLPIRDGGEVQTILFFETAQKTED